jgi:hypothetical protein
VGQFEAPFTEAFLADIGVRYIGTTKLQLLQCVFLRMLTIYLKDDSKNEDEEELQKPEPEELELPF